MSDPNQPSTPPGWYPDGQGGQRWWDGSQWTEHTQPPAGDAPADPVAPAEPAEPAAPEAPAAPASPARPSGPGVPGGDLPTQVAPNRASNYPAGQPGQPASDQPQAQQPQQPQQPVYGAPTGSYGQPTGQAGYGQQPFGGSTAASGGSGGGKGKLIAIIGGAIGAVLLVIILLFVLFTVILGGGPEDVASDYLEANADGDFEEACELSSKEHQESAFEGTDASECGELEEAIAKSFEEQGIPGYDNYEDLFDDIEYDFEIGDVSEKEESATVEYTYTVEYTGDEEDFGGVFDQKDQDAEIGLVKEDGDWKVDSDSGDF